MARGANTTGAKRYDDMIGYLVAFEKRAKTMEVCCDLQSDAIISNESSSSSAQYVRHARSIKRSNRGRLRDPVPTRCEGIVNNKSCESITMASDTVDNPRKMKVESEHKIIAVSDVVEVIMTCNDSDAEENLGTTGSHYSIPMDKRVKDENGSSIAFDNFDFKAVSSSSSTVTVPQQGMKLGACNEGQFLSSDFNHTAISEKFHETSILRQSRILREQQQSESNQKVIGVFFRDPIHEVIPFKQGTRL
jgi:hypothetical protein